MSQNKVFRIKTFGVPQWVRGLISWAFRWLFGIERIPRGHVCVLFRDGTYLYVPAGEALGYADREDFSNVFIPPGMDRG